MILFYLHDSFFYPYHKHKNGNLLLIFIQGWKGIPNDRILSGSWNSELLLSLGFSFEERVR